MPRGRPRRLSGDELVEKLNEVVAELIKENRALKRQIDKLAVRGTSTANRAVETGLRAIQKRAQQALSEKPRRRPRAHGQPPADGRRRRKASES